MAATEAVGGPRVRLTSIYARGLLLTTLVVTASMLATTLLMASTRLIGSSHCAAAAGDRKYRRRSASANDSGGISGLRRRFAVDNRRLCDVVYDDDGMTSLPVYVVVVHSRPGQRGRMQRDAIRATWGSTLHRRVAEPDIRLAFVLGRDRKCVVMTSCAEALRRESRLYGDLIVADFVDTYRNLSLKSLFGLAWARRRCRSARYIVKVDDDVYLRPNLLPRVRRLRSDSSDSVIVGSLNVNSTVQRRGLWRVDERAFPARVFPSYCSGNVYAMASSVADRLLAVAETDAESAPFPLEDVYITALLAASVDAHCVDDDAFPQWGVGPSPSNVDRLRNGSLLALHNVDYTQMYDIARQLDNNGRR